MRATPWLMGVLVLASVAAGSPETPAEKSAPSELREVRRPKSDWTESGFATARVGDFTLHQIGDNPLNTTRVEVTAVGDHTVTLKVKARFGSVNIPERQIKYLFDEPDQQPKPAPKTDPKTAPKTTPKDAPPTPPEPVAPPPAASVKLENRTSKVNVRVGSRELDAELRETLRDGKVVSQVWHSSEVPFDGIIKRIGPSGIALKTLIDFGRGPQ